MPKAPQIRGLRWVRTDLPDEAHCAFEASADAATVDALLQVVPPGGGLEFFDYLYHGEPPEGSQLDHGAVFCVYCDRTGDLASRCGNHGWSSEWARVDRRKLAWFLLGCLDSNRGDGPRSLAMRLKRRVEPPERVAAAPDEMLFMRRDLFEKERRKGSGE